MLKDEDMKIIKEALEEDPPVTFNINRKPSSLDALNKVRELLENKYGLLEYIDYLDIIGNALKFVSELQVDYLRPKEMKTLELLKTRMPDIKEFRVFNAEHKKATVKDWNYYHPNMPLNQDEFDLLKEQLCQ